MLRRTSYLVYGMVCYAIFLGTFLYAIGFVGNVVVPRTIDTPRSGSLLTALLVNSGLLILFALQHSVMARPGFKRWWTRFVPEPIERSTYVLATCIALVALFYFWQPIGGTVWNVTHPVGRWALIALCAQGWITVLITTFLINHFDLFGLRQTWLAFRGQQYTHVSFRTPGPYKLVRHPLYVGWLLAFWATPTMTAAHAFFALVITAYILIAIQLEEKDLIAAHGQSYVDYRNSTPMLIPSARRGATVPAATAAAN